MPKRMTEEQRHEVLRLLARGEDRDTIAAAVGVTPGQVSAVAAHVKMGTYSLPAPENDGGKATPEGQERTANLLRQLQDLEPATERETRLGGILLGEDAETGEAVFWNPDPASGAANPHVLVLGESGFGKTYTIACLLAELAREDVVSIVFDYGQGFSPSTLPREFQAATDLVKVHGGRDGVDINPLQIFPSDLHGPVNVAQRIADTFARVYKGMGVQQHAVVRQAVLDVMADAGILPEAPDSWTADLPAFVNLQSKLLAYARDPANSQARFAASAASHVSTVFVLNTFRANGQKLAWPDLLEPANRVVVVQLKGPEYSLERAVTEFLLWNLVGFMEAMGTLLK
jgi:DNA phosphorothioation-dependent restriction protein DptH